MRAFVGLGSNVGDRHAFMRAAVAALRASDDIVIVATSSVYETKAIGPEQPDFLNAVVEISTRLAPHALLGVLKETESHVGRTPGERWGPREIDLDLLLFGDDVISDDGLEVPHPRMRERAFVLVPLRELDLDLAEPIDDAGVRRTDLLLD